MEYFTFTRTSEDGELTGAEHKPADPVSLALQIRKWEASDSNSVLRLRLTGVDAKARGNGGGPGKDGAKGESGKMKKKERRGRNRKVKKKEKKETRGN